MNERKYDKDDTSGKVKMDGISGIVNQNEFHFNKKENTSAQFQKW